MTNIATLRRRLAEIAKRAPRTNLPDLDRMTTGEMRRRLCEILKITPTELAEGYREIVQTLRAEAERAD